ncbi:cyclin-dependent kinase [Ranunculus cassubicifolius]
MVLMIIKGLFRRYERWNPVHPTSGSFWGMGIGLGCGVGWGPGFGPEVVGYVGAGCGVGFSVGFTLAGVGIGLPVTSPVELPYNAFVATGTSMVEFARSNAVVDGWNHVGPSFSGLQREANRRWSGFNQGIDLTEMKKQLNHQCRSFSECLQAIRIHHFQPHKGM